MAGDERQVRRLRATPLLVVAGLIQLGALAVFAVNFPTSRTPVAVGWLGAPLATILAAVACWEAGGTRGLDQVARRLWRQLAVVCVVVAAGTVVDGGFAIAAAPGVRHAGAFSGMLYLLAVLLLLWALLRLPIGLGDQRDRLVRFVLDTAVITVTVSIFAWYYLIRQVGSWDISVRMAVPMIALIMIGLIGTVAFTKVAFSGFGGLDGTAVRLLALACIVGAAGGGVFPLVLDLPAHLHAAQIFVPATMLCVDFAADRQRRAAGVPRADRRRRPFSIVPYAAVAAADGLLLTVARDAGLITMVVAGVAVILTAMVAGRQLSALRENRRLLQRVDTSLAELNRYQAELTHRATHDQLTDLANRALFEEYSRSALAAVATGEVMSLALIDLDDFKGINDRLGHAVGDALLSVVADRLRGCVRHTDLVARLGGDEFGLLMPGLRSEEAADALHRIAQALTRPVHAAGHDLLVQASIGLAEAWPGAGPQELLRRADLAMYAAKERGKGRYAVYDARLEQHEAADAQLGAELRQGIDRAEFFLVFQPIVALPDGRWTAVEALVRWQHPERGLVPPDVFVPIAERTGLIVALGEWILRTACAQAAEWLATYGTYAPGEIGVNVSARQLREPGFASVVAQALAESGLPPARLMVEVTETAVFDGGIALDTLSALATLGVGVALDDFGTGHSSLGLLRTCPADTLKVDKSFVDGIGTAGEEAIIATAMIQITDGLHLQAIAEGVETAAQAQTLHRLGYRFAQGYHFSRPLTAAQVRERLEAARAMACASPTLPGPPGS